MLMKPLVPRHIFYLDVGQIIDPHSDTSAFRPARDDSASLQPARELHVRKHRCLDATDTTRLVRCRRTYPRIVAELSAKEREFT
jgi:hypothetical protein